jgi:hypothetical protein
MKLKASEVVTIVVVLKAIREGKIVGEQVAEAFIGMAIDKFVEGSPEEIAVIKMLAKDVDAGFLADILDSILKRFVAKQPKEE